MTRQFYLNQEFDINDVYYKIVAGKKESRVPGEQDLRLDREGPNGWQPVAMKEIGLCVNFFYENEAILYPPPRFLGGEKLMQFLDIAKTDWRAAAQGLEAEKLNKRHNEW